MAPREVVLGLDNLERGVSLFAAGVAFVLALVTGIELARNTPVTTTVKPTKGVCPKHVPAFRLVTSLCEYTTHQTRGYWGIRFAFVFVVALCILFFTLRRKRAAVICFALFLGLGLGIESGLVFLFLGVWLIVRAWRLQRYGVPTMLGANRMAREIGQAKREGRAASVTSARDANPPSPKPATPPPASKRYTPKKPPRKRR